MGPGLQVRHVERWANHNRSGEPWDCFYPLWSRAQAHVRGMADLRLGWVCGIKERTPIGVLSRTQEEDTFLFPRARSFENRHSWSGKSSGREEMSKDKSGTLQLAKCWGCCRTTKKSREAFRGESQTRP